MSDKTGPLAGVPYDGADSAYADLYHDLPKYYPYSEHILNDRQAPDAWNGAVVRDNLKVHPDTHLVQGADHFVFLAPCSDALAAVAAPICQDPAGFDRAAFHRAFNQSVVDFFTTRLRDR